MNCVFCRIVAKEIPAAVVYEDDLTIAFMDAGQVNPGHVLVAAKGHAENLYELTDAQAAALLKTAAHLAMQAVATRGTAVTSGAMDQAWQASSAAAGALMLMARAKQELETALAPPGSR